MSKHPYHKMLRALNKQRNNMIQDFRHFKRDPVNRKWMPHRAFSNTLTEFRKKIAEVDKLIVGAKLAITVSLATGVKHWFDYDSNTVVADKENNSK